MTPALPVLGEAMVDALFGGVDAVEVVWNEGTGRRLEKTK